MENKPNNNKKNILIYIMFIAIIAILLVGIIYQFVCIKSLESQLDAATSNIVGNYLKQLLIKL